MTGIEILSQKSRNRKAGTGDVVLSTSGRDRGRLYLVIAVLKENCVLVTDGKGRGLTNPKLKNAKHLKFIANESFSCTSNEELTELLSRYENDFSVLRKRYYKAKRGDYSAER